MIEILILRHAPTGWNRDRRIQGRADVPLSIEGEALARSWRLPEGAARWPCRASPLERAMATARIMGLEPEADEAFVEMDWGALEGRTLADIRAAGGDAFAAEEARGLDFRPLGGETPREVAMRASAGLRALGENAVIVTHKGVLRALFALALGWDMRTRPPMRIEDGCVHRFALAPEGRLSLLGANIALGGLLPQAPLGETPPPPSDGERRRKPVP